MNVPHKAVKNNAKDATRDMRYLCSTDAERMSDYLRINMLVKTGNRMCAIIDDLLKAINNAK